jgi:hypothetical protein
MLPGQDIHNLFAEELGASKIMRRVEVGNDQYPQDSTPFSLIE